MGFFFKIFETLGFNSKNGFIFKPLEKLISLHEENCIIRAYVERER